MMIIKTIELTEISKTSRVENQLSSKTQADSHSLKETAENKRISIKMSEVALLPFRNLIVYLEKVLKSVQFQKKHSRRKVFVNLITGFQNSRGQNAQSRDPRSKLGSLSFQELQKISEGLDTEIETAEASVSNLRDYLECSHFALLASVISLQE